ncbi:barstar family protein [Photobacterium aquae]|uniref:barstar family protein n=1 Tax=Photobacterium aquae TaxID=1195763 RepID=UPI001F0A3813|nr:barstar family protein [Photobacterium aquae]
MPIVLTLNGAKKKIFGRCSGHSGVNENSVYRGTMRIDLRMIESKIQLHELMANCLGFPDFYGKNWDAFWDCLCDLGLRDSDLPKVIEFVGSSHLKSTLPECFESLKSCFDDLRREYPNIDTRVEWN